ncbi:MAG: Metallophos protein [Candidatus Poribacteria bacterium]|nr:Metallophos protein [Candidatus Poribacteria bacterium]
MYKRIFVTFFVAILVFVNIAFSEESFLEKGNIPSLKRVFSADSDKFTFAIIGDKTGGGEQNWPIFDRAVEEINLLDPDFAMTVGDHIQGYSSDVNAMEKMWKEYMEHLSVLKMPVIFVPGNHDISNTIMYKFWQEKLGKTHFSFDYKGCHFVGINTEEYQAPESATAIKEFSDFLISDINKNKSAKHIFIFMHRPLWLEDKGMWKNIDSALEGSNYTVFAGHYHNLSSSVINNHKYIVLSATGAGLDEFPLPELGMFHHYTVVTVDGENANIAIVRPGNIMPETVSNTEFHRKLESSVSFKQEMPVPVGKEMVTGKFSVVLKNEVTKPLKVNIKASGVNENLWKMAPLETVLDAAPGEEKQATFELSYNSDSILTLPKYAIEFYYDGKLLYKTERKIEFADTNSMRKIDKWSMGVVFDVPDVKGKSSTDAETIVYNYFPTKLGPEMGLKTYFSTTAEAKNGMLDLDAFYEKADYAIAYSQAYVYSPADATVWSAIKVDDVASVFVNGNQSSRVFKLKDSGGQFDFFPMSLKAGWNQVMVKCADLTGGWNFTFGLDDPQSKLKFSDKSQ